ncbi:MAG: alpha/beta hydrolase [Chloroflexi bacterium]|nr:alpha/beta hydrolase [Chloroflexota bacterium]
MPRIDADGVELFYESLGEGTPLILHGHDHTPWLFFQAPIFSQTYRFITFDRRGTGRSASPAGEWTVADFARDIRNLLDALHIDRAIVGGSSLGGIVSAQFAVDYPERLLGFIVGHTGPYFWDLAREWVEELMRGAQPTLGAQPRSYAWEVEGPPTTNPLFAASPIGRLMASVGTGLGRDAESIRKMHRALLNWDQRPRYADLHALRVPALFIAGANEPQKTLELMMEWHAQVPNAELVILRDCYHAAHRENAPLWNAAVQSFLSRNRL